MAAVCQLGYVGLEVSDLDAWRSLAGEVLGFEVADREEDGAVLLRMDENNHRLALFEGPADDLLYSGWQVQKPEDFNEIREQLTAAGIDVTDGTEDELKSRCVQAMYKFVIGGVPFEVFYGPTINWERPPAFGRPIGGFLTGEQGVGHIVVQSGDMENSVRTLIDILGFKVSDYIWDITFLHCNPRHHSLAVEPPMVRDRSKKLAHIMVEVNELDDVGFAWDLVRERNIPWFKTIGKHVNDHMVSFYLVTPSGFHLEYGWGGLEIDDDVWEVQHHQVPSMWGHRRPEES